MQHRYKTQIYNFVSQTQSLPKIFFNFDWFDENYIGIGTTYLLQYNLLSTVTVTLWHNDSGSNYLNLSLLTGDILTPTIILHLPAPTPLHCIHQYSIIFHFQTCQLLPLDCHSNICLATHLPHSSQHFPHHHAYHRQHHPTHLLLHHIYPHMLQSSQRIKVYLTSLYLLSDPNWPQDFLGRATVLKYSRLNPLSE